jgi:CBS domain-containing protein
MVETTKNLLSLTAAGLMSRNVVLLPEHMALREAARLLVQNQIGGAPVVDKTGRCVGMLTAIDFLRLAGKRNDVIRPAAPPLPITCPFWIKQPGADGKGLTVCTLPPGVCPIQLRQVDDEGNETLICRQPHCVLTDWQMVDVEKLPDTEVRHYMTTDCVTVPPHTSIPRLARIMIDAHIHRAIVIDEQERPIGIISTTDMLGALAYAEDDIPAENDREGQSWINHRDPANTKSCA